MGIFNFTIDNSTLPSRPWKDGLDYWSSFELYPEWKGSSYYVFRGIAHHARDYWTGTPVVVKTFQNKHALGDDWTLYCSTAGEARKLASGYNSYLNANGYTVQVDFVKPIEVVMDSISDLMPILQYIMRFHKRFVKSEIVVMEDLLEDSEFMTFVTDRGEAAYNGSRELDAFAHFTYHESYGETLVCGLQGVEQNQDGRKRTYKLTNPVIHSVSRKFGQKDRGQAGIDQFFASHVCIRGLCDGFRKPDPNLPPPYAP